MTDSRNIAGLIGPTLIALAISEGLNLRIWSNLPAAHVYLNGTLLFVAGLSIVRAHNRWTRDWTVTVTLVGWFATLGGLFRMFAPDVQQLTSAFALFPLLVVLLAIGILLTFKGYSREDNETAVHAGRTL